MEIKLVGSNGEIEQAEPRRESEIEATPVMKDGEFLVQNVANMFDLKPTEINLNESKLNTLIEYAKSVTKEQTPENLKWAIRSLQGRLGSPPLGEKWINYLSRFAYLHLEGVKIEKEKQKYDNHGSL